MCQLSETDMDKFLMSMPVIILPIERVPKKVIIVVSIILLGTFLTALASSIIIGFWKGTVSEEAVPAKESEMGAQASIINMLYFVVIVLVVTFVIVMLIKYGKFNIIRMFMVSVVVLMIFSFTQMMVALYQLYIVVMLYSLGYSVVVWWVEFILPISLVFVCIFTIIYVMSVAKAKYINARNIILILNAIWAAVWLAWSSGILSPVMILIGMALYDLYSVFRGPLRDLADVIVSRGEGRGEDIGIIVGLGDIFFYSFAIAYSYAVLGIIEAIVVIVILLVGAILTFMLLLKFENRALPALPIPILSAVTFIIVFLYIVR